VRILLTSAFIFIFSSAFLSQGVTPEQQRKIDSLMLYVNTRLQNNKPVDQGYIDSVNAVIRSMNPKSTVAGPQSLKADSAKEITKQSMAGTSFTVPAGKTWKVKRMYVNDGGSYNILVTSIKFDKPYSEDEKLLVPAWTAEAELLSGDKSGFNYIFKIEESSSKK
jgi:hypothetical protein